ncbi:MAG TPA: M20/M25/M40 family metallo-hydrolase [Longimicrobiales bacterium]|nr:M20/M25/M40 family metallo-hydrolase [Longimicrobiales bacterium]
MLRRIWEEGVDRSQIYRLSQVLLDSVGPRLTGTPDARRAKDWLVATYAAWGVPARLEQYGTWGGWRRGITHIDLLQPRVRTLEGTLLGWSAGTRGRPVQGPVIVLPDLADSVALRQWLPSARGRFVAIDLAQPTCRPDRHGEEFGAAPAGRAVGDTLGSFRRMQTERREAQQAWTARRQRTGLTADRLRTELEDAGALGILQSNWSNETGINKVFTANTRRAPTLDLSCEDYGLVFRLAEHDQGPVLRVSADAEHLGDVPVHNVIAEIRGTERPHEVVLLSAHFDSFDAGSGATDNGTGTLTMLEAIRILRQVYPNPRRTIMVGHWDSEEQGLNGSRAFAADHPEIVRNLQAVFNQDNGTGRIQNISMQGLVGAGEHFARWFARLPAELTRDVRLQIPGSPGGGGSDHAAFVCSGAPGFSLSSLPWAYFSYTWHTNRDTFDKLVFDDLRNNAVLVAMLTYLASEDPERIPLERRTVLAPGFGAQPPSWPECREPARRQP